MVLSKWSKRAPVRAEDGNHYAEVKAPLMPGARRAPTPLPLRQLLIICLIRSVEPVCFNVIFAFVNDMILHVGAAKDTASVGYYSGIVEGIFPAAQFFTVLWWGQLSDRIGRRPVLMYGLTGLVFATLLFGCAESLWVMLLGRALMGMLNGNVAVLKSAIGEITDSTNRAQGFAFEPLAWNIGCVVAPMFGGMLARPAERFPSLFGSWWLFIKYPFLLPCLASAIVAALGAIFALVMFEETLESKRNGPRVPRDIELESPKESEMSPSIASTTALPAPHMTARQILRIPRVRAIMSNIVFVSFNQVTVEAVFVLYLYSPLRDGGLGFTGPQIGITLASNALCFIMLNTLLYPRMHRIYGTMTLYLTCVASVAPLTLFYPLTHYFAVQEQPTFVLLGVSIIVFLKSVGTLVWPGVMILVNASSPSRGSLGTLNGLSQMASSASRAVGPAIATTLYALSMSNNLLGGNLVYLFMLCVWGGWMFVSFGILRHHNFDEED